MKGTLDNRIFTRLQTTIYCTGKPFTKIHVYLGEIMQGCIATFCQQITLHRDHVGNGEYNLFVNHARFKGLRAP